MPGLRSFFVSTRGTWYRRLGSYSIQIVEQDTAEPLGTPAELEVTGHAPRMIYGRRRAAA